MYRSHSLMKSKDLSAYKSLEGWRHCNSLRSKSFKKFLSLMTSTYASTFGIDMRALITPRLLTYTENSGRVTRNSVELIQSNQGMQESTSLTPSRKVLKRYESNQVSDEIKRRRTQCNGIIVFRVCMQGNKVSMDGGGARGLCIVCSKKTHYYCIGCHHWLCGPNTESNDDDSGKQQVRYLDDANKRIYFRNSCWHQFHEDSKA